MFKRNYKYIRRRAQSIVGMPGPAAQESSKVQPTDEDDYLSRNVQPGVDIDNALKLFTLRSLAGTSLILGCTATAGGGIEALSVKQARHGAKHTGQPADRRLAVAAGGRGPCAARTGALATPWLGARLRMALSGHVRGRPAKEHEDTSL